MLNESEGGSIMGKDFLIEKIMEQENALENAQHRVVVELSSARLEMMRDMHARLTIDRALMLTIPSKEAKRALDDVFHDFEIRLEGVFHDMDKDTEGLISAYADKEDCEARYIDCMTQGTEAKKRFFGRRQSAEHFEEAARQAAAMVRASERILSLRKKIAQHEQSLKRGQEKILGLIEEFINRYKDTQKQIISAE